MRGRTLYHASTVQDIKEFRDNSHFAFEEEPCNNVIARKIFADTLHLKEIVVFKPMLYRCEADIDALQLDTYHDLASPFVAGLFDAWRERLLDREQTAAGFDEMAHGERMDYCLTVRHPRSKELSQQFWADKNEAAQVQWMKERLAEGGFLGYRYDNTVEGGKSICLLDASKVRIVEKIPLSLHAIARHWLSGPTDHVEACLKHSIRLDAKYYGRSRRRAERVLKMPDVVCPAD